MIEQYITVDEVEQLKHKCHWLIDRFTSPAKLRRVYSFMNRIYCRPAIEPTTLNGAKETEQ